MAPTWRSWLVPELAVGSQRRSLVLADFLETDYAKNWLPFLQPPELAEVCERMGLTIGFLPHPNIQPILGQLDLPAHVKALTFAGTDVQELFARSRLLVTDYSSVAFNAAYIDRPTVYFQFDRERVLSGGHVGRAGYFDYERDGFGPVAIGPRGRARGHGRQPEGRARAVTDLPGTGSRAPSRCGTAGAVSASWARSRR